MSADRELLELAAKAASLKGYIGNGARFVVLDDNGNITDQLFRPLEDDGDALRLAVRLGLSVEVFHGRTIAKTHFGKNGHLAFAMADEKGDDRLICTRRAIVRAAAEIGRAM